METVYADSCSDMAQSCDIDLWVMKWRSSWPVFHDPVILPYILKTIWCMNFILWEYESVWPEVWPQNKCRSLWPIFHGPKILMYEHHYLGLWISDSWRLFDGECCTWDNGSVWLKDRPCNICRSVTYISWSIDFALCHCHRLKLFLYIKKWCRPGVFMFLALATFCRQQGYVDIFLHCVHFCSQKFYMYIIAQT